MLDCISDFARYRPMNAMEEGKGDRCLQVTPDCRGVKHSVRHHVIFYIFPCNHPSPQEGTVEHSFQFDGVFDEAASQQEVYETVARPMIDGNVMSSALSQ